MHQSAQSVQCVECSVHTIHGVAFQEVVFCCVYCGVHCNVHCTVYRQFMVVCFSQSCAGVRELTEVVAGIFSLMTPGVSMLELWSRAANKNV